MNSNIWIGILVTSGIMVVSAITVSAISDVSSASTQSNQIDIKKKSESMDVFFDGNTINVKNTGKYGLEIAMFRFYDKLGVEVHRTIISDSGGRVFGGVLPIVKNTLLTSNDVYLQSQVPKSYTTADIGINSFDELSGEVVTTRGRTFPIVFENSDDVSPSFNNNTYSTSSSNATSVLNGFGINSLIYTISELGEVIWGTGIIGTTESLTPYTLTNSSANFAAILLDTDTKNTYPISEFWREYSYSGSTLSDVTATLPNILGYSQSRTTVGSVVTTISNNGITVSGTGEAIFKLHDYSGQSLILRGDSGTGVAKIITSQIDLMGATYTSGLGYLSHSGDNPGTNGISIVAGIDSTHTGKYDNTWWVECTYHWHSFRGGGGSFNHQHGCYQAYSYDNISTLVKVNNIDHQIITGHTQNTGYNFRLYDTLPSIQGIKLSGGTFETNYQFPNEQSYLFVNPNGGTVTIKGETSMDIPIVSIVNLPDNTPYQISKDGWIGAVGVTSSTGTITLYDSDVNFEGFTTQGGLLHLYPDSLSYRGAFTTLCFDTENREIFHVTDGYDQICTPSAFVSLPVSMDVEVDEISSGTVTFDYLAGNKTVGDSIHVPIIPGMETISFMLNGINAVINIKDITNTAQSKILSTVTDSNTLYATGSAIENIAVGVSNTAILIATHTGTMNAVIIATASGEATFTINSDYTGSYEQTYDICQAAMAAYGAANGCIQHGHPTDGLILAALARGQAALDSQLTSHIAALESAIIAQGPLTVTATVFNNGVYVDTFEIFDDLNPIFTASSDLGLVSVQNANVVYTSTTGSNIISLDVEAGDYIELIINAGLIVSGIPSPISLNDATIAGFASGTVTLHSGSITASMG